MRIGINARLLTVPSMRGWNRYTVNLLSELGAQGMDLVLYAHEPIHPVHLERLQPGSYEVRISPALPYALWEEFWLPRQCKADRIDVLHSTFHFGLPWRSHCPRVLTLHDAIDQAYYRPRRTWKQTFSRATLETGVYCWIARARASHIIAVSEHAKQELVHYLQLPASKITVTHEGADPQFHLPVAESEVARALTKHRLRRPYFFYVGGWEERKNLPFLVQAYAEARVSGVDLALAGGTPAEVAEMARLATALGVAERVQLLGWVDDPDLRALYRGARAFVYPSSHEGFGLQLCEAMAVGCPVLAARATSLPEILQNGGETFSLADTRELSGLLSRVAAEGPFCEQLAERARIRSGALSWNRTARETIAVYRKVLSAAA